MWALIELHTDHPWKRRKKGASITYQSPGHLGREWTIKGICLQDFFLFFFLLYRFIAYVIKDFRSSLLFQVVWKIICVPLITGLNWKEQSRKFICSGLNMRLVKTGNRYIGNFSPLCLCEQQAVANMPLSFGRHIIADTISCILTQSKKQIGAKI